MVQATRLPDDERSPFQRPAYDYIGQEQGSARASMLMGFRLHALSGEDKVILQIVGVSTIITCLIMGIAFGFTTAIVGISKLF